MSLSDFFSSTRCLDLRIAIAYRIVLSGMLVFAFISFAERGLDKTPIIFLADFGKTK